MLDKSRRPTTAANAWATGCVIALLAILLTGCGSNDAASAPSLARAAAGDEKAPTRNGDPRPHCPNPHGGQCLGPIKPGTYTTVSFSPAITYTVPAGWTNDEDLPGNFALRLDGDTRYLGIYRDANAPYKCEEYPDPDVSQSVSDYTRWLRTNPLLRVTKPIPVSLGGLHGVVMNISKAPGTEGKGCTYEEERSRAPCPSSSAAAARPAFITSSWTAGRSGSTSCATNAATSRSKFSPKATA